MFCQMQRFIGLMLNVPVNSYGHVGMLPPFYGTRAIRWPSFAWRHKQPIYFFRPQWVGACAKVRKINIVQYKNADFKMILKKGGTVLTV